MVATASAPRVRFVRIRRGDAHRHLALLDAVTRARYVRLVASAAGEIEARLSDAVVANRVRSWRIEPPDLRLRPWRMERRIFGARLTELSGRASAIAFADVHRCYASVTPDRVGEWLGRANVAAAVDIEGLLRDLQRHGVPGLPIGPEPSAVLANAVMSDVDRALSAAGIEHLRWVDDVVLATSDPGAALDTLRTALGRIGLRLNEHKTRVVVEPSSLGPRIGPSTSR